MIIFKNEYTCQRPFCGKTFESKVDLIIQPQISPTCSNGCRFKVIYRIISKRTNSVLLKMFDETFPDETLPKKRSEVIYLLTKFYSRTSSLSSLSSIGLNELSGQKVESNTNNFVCVGSKTHKLVCSLLCIYGQSELSELTFSGTF